jgi:hypothetical protein
VEDIKLSLFADDVTPKDPKDSSGKLIALINTFSKAAG